MTKRARIARQPRYVRVPAAAAFSLSLLLSVCMGHANKSLAAGKTAGRTAPKSTAAPAKGVVARYAAAMKLYNAGKFNEALVALDQLHRAYPSHEPTVIQYAKTLYRLDRINESYNLFARINPQYLDAETSYEYGYSFYTQNKFDGALYAFKRVPNDHALFDLASYYGSMCALRMKRYAEAEDLLDKAVVLPDKLARSKSLYQKHIASLRQLQEKNELERTVQDEQLRSISDQAKAKAQSSQSPASAGPATPQLYIHGGFFSVKKVSRLKAIKTSQTSDFHGYSQKSYESQAGVFSLNNGPLLPLPLKLDGDRQAAFGLQVDASVSSVTTSGTQQRLVAYEDSRDIVHQLTDKLPTQTSTLGDIGGTAWIETPMPAGWWLGTNGHLSFTYPNFARGRRYGIRGVTGHLGWKKDKLNSWFAELTGTYDLIVDSETEPVTAQAITEGRFGSVTSFNMEISAGGRHVVYDYKLPLLPGPDSSTSGNLTVLQAFPLGLKVEINGTIEQQKNYIVRDLGSFSSAAADGSILSGYAKLEASPVSWLTIAARHARSQSSWTVLQPERVEAFKAATPSYTETTDISGSINFWF